MGKFEELFEPILYLGLFALSLLLNYKLHAIKVFNICFIPIMVLCSGTIYIAVAIIVAVKNIFPTIKDVNKLNSNVMFYYTSSFCIHPKYVIKVIIILVLLTVASIFLIILTMIYPLGITSITEVLSYTVTLGLSSIVISQLMLDYIVFPTYFFSPVFGFRVGDRLVLICTGYSDAEVISSGPVEVDGFVEKYKFPVKTTDRDDLTIRIGYFKTGVYTLKPPDHGFFFLRTRGLCVFRDERTLMDDESAFELARWWEKFSMVYAALCLKNNGLPSDKELERFMRKVKNNCQKGLKVRYLGATMSLRLFIKDNISIGIVAISFIPSAIMRFLNNLLISAILMSPPLILLIASVISYCFAIFTRRLNKKAVTNCKWYNMILNKNRINIELYKVNNIVYNDMFEFKRILRRLNELDLG